MASEGQLGIIAELFFLLIDTPFKILAAKGDYIY